MRTRFLLLALLGFFALSAQAQQTPSNLRDLLDEKSRFAENTMNERGYVNVAGAESSKGVYSYWWNQQRNECVCVLTNNARYVSIKDTSPIDCNRNVHANATDNKNKGAGLAVGAAAAAIIGAAILSNKSHHHDDNKHYDDHETEGAFEQGYRDGKFHTSYHNPFNDDSHVQAYAKGYQAGVDERESETSYHSGRGGYQSHTNIYDLKGRPISEVNRELRNRGFEMTDQNGSGGDAMEWWSNRQTSQCYMLSFNNSYLRQIDKVDSCY